MDVVRVSVGVNEGRPCLKGEALSIIQRSDELSGQRMVHRCKRDQVTNMTESIRAQLL